jgi:hypothetical protein
MENVQCHICVTPNVSTYIYIIVPSDQLSHCDSAILTILQIDDVSADPVPRYSALFSLVCALISLLFGCMYIIRFGSMRKTYKAAEWALVCLSSLSACR